MTYVAKKNPESRMVTNKIKDNTAANAVMLPVSIARAMRCVKVRSVRGFPAVLTRLRVMESYRNELRLWRW